jgi:TetR/AcrR family transcriptional regulator
MVTSTTKPSRRQQILESLAYMLEENKGGRITTAKLAAEVGVSEAALYRHFPSKAKMFESLIEFIEESIFTRINIITNQSSIEDDQVGKIINLVITFASRNPGISRILTGEALTGEQDRLRQRVAQLFSRLEVQIKQVLREKAARSNKDTIDAAIIANLLMNIIDGRLQQFVRSDFKRSPLEAWDQQWQLLHQQLLD